MKMILLQRTIASIVAALAGSSLHVGIRAVQLDPPPLSFRFVARHCLAESYDSTTGLFTKELSPRGIPIPLATTRLTLALAQMQAISMKLQEIEFFAYPSRF